MFFEERYVPPGINTSDSKIQDNTRRGWIGGAQALVLPSVAVTLRLATL